tara:strand:- start:60 stop:314 length:255 start_codon:yes stop_codon:yes gene_type:complete
MALVIDGAVYLSASEVAERLDISRQTLWRWRQDGKIPQGHRYRGRQVLFSKTEFDAIHSFANRLEPIKAGFDQAQLRLFSGGRG